MKSKFLSTLFWMAIIVLLAILAFSCNKHICPEVSNNVSNNTYTKDSTYWRDYWLKTSADTNWFKAWVECQNGKAQLKKQITETKNNIITTEVKDGQLSTEVINKADSEKVNVPVRVIIISKSQYSCKVYVKYIEKPLKWWQKAGLWGFLILFIFDSVYIVVKWAINKNKTIRALIGKLK